MEHLALVIAVIGILIFLSHVFTSIFSRTRIPDVLLLILIGIALGPVLDLVSPTQFGVVGPIFVTVTLIIILFEGGMALRLETLRSAAGGAMALATLSFFATMAITAGIALATTDLGLIPALILGAILGSTSEAIVIPLASQLKLRKESQTVLSLESSLNDVLSVVITIALVEAQKIGKVQLLSITSSLISSFVVAIVLGAVGAIVWSFLLNKIHTVKNAAFTTPAFLFIIYGIVETLGFNGAIAALTFGITLGNIGVARLYTFKKSYLSRPVGLTETEKVFFSETAFLLRTFFFIYLGISLEMINSQLAFLVAAVSIAAFVVRIPLVRFLVSNKTQPRDASMIAAMVPRGLAAAVLASIPLQQGIAGGALIRSVTYGVILLTIVLSSLLVLFIDKTGLSSWYAWMVSRRHPTDTDTDSPVDQAEAAGQGPSEVAAP